ncbi:MAG TPA: hypothetical protein VN493_13955 [Thermoanaerobaculia bacterium]|nr:hypothetical protein [Thermoanaerobaculia bacterium]
MRKALLTLALAGSLAAGRPALLDQLWSLLTSVWSASSPDAGCIADPDGRCRPAPQTDEGCGADPSGGCRPRS